MYERVSDDETTESVGRKHKKGSGVFKWIAIAGLVAAVAYLAHTVSSQAKQLDKLKGGDKNMLVPNDQ